MIGKTFKSTSMPVRNLSRACWAAVYLHMLYTGVAMYYDNGEK